MYFPYFRGKQFELITIRETADQMATAGFSPIIEPVKETLSGLDRALSALCDAGVAATVVVNPHYGDHAEGGGAISDLIKQFVGKGDIGAGILLKEGISVADALGLRNEHVDHDPVFVHAGFTQAKALAEGLGENLPGTRHAFFEKYAGKLYRKHFDSATRMLLRDGFERRRNADYPEVEEFSDLHITYVDEGMDGFGDFLIVGDEFRDGGGPAYAVAIHLTFIDPDKDDAMYVYHFVSTTKDTPTDPGGKFGQALGKLIAKLDSGTSKLFETEAIEEFRLLHEKGHFPGLGHIKKLSMNHHIQTLAGYFE